MPQLTLEIVAGVATVSFDHPPLQVMTPATMNELDAMLPRLRDDDAVRAVVFTGNAASGYFIRHFSVEELDANTRGSGGGWGRSMDEVLWDMEHLPKPVIAALDGSAWGGGLEFALACDIRVAKDGAFRFGLPEVSVGILPGGGGTQRLTEVVGRGRALDLMLRPRLITAAQAHALGIFEELVPADTAESACDRAQAIAWEIASRSPHAVRRIKALVRGAASPVDRAMLAKESRLFAELMATDEARAKLAGAAVNARAQSAELRDR